MPSRTLLKLLKAALLAPQHPQLLFQALKLGRAMIEAPRDGVAHRRRGAVDQGVQEALQGPTEDADVVQHAALQVGEDHVQQPSEAAGGPAEDEDERQEHHEPQGAALPQELLVVFEGRALVLVRVAGGDLVQQVAQAVRDAPIDLACKAMRVLERLRSPNGVGDRQPQRQIEGGQSSRHVESPTASSEPRRTVPSVVFSILPTSPTALRPITSRSCRWGHWPGAAAPVPGTAAADLERHL